LLSLGLQERFSVSVTMLMDSLLDSVLLFRIGQKLSVSKARYQFERSVLSSAMACSLLVVLFGNHNFNPNIQRNVFFLESS